MKAAVYDRTGPAREVLRVVEVPDPEPAPGEVRVRLEVSGVNPTDWKRRADAQRSSGERSLPRPQIPGQDGAGVVDAIGAGVDEAVLGRRVWVYHAAYERPGGTSAQYVCVPARQAVALPVGVPMAQGAGLGIPYMTAHRCLFAGGSLAGRTVLVTGGAGAVGGAAVQLARWAGARVVATVSSVEKARLAMAAGAHETLDYRAPDFAERLGAAAPEGVDRVVDVAVAANLPAYAACLAPGAGIAAYATTSAPDGPLPVSTLMRRNVDVGFVLVYTVPQPALDRAAADITAALRAGALSPPPEHHFPLEDVAGAHEAVERGAIGKVLIDLP